MRQTLITCSIGLACQPYTPMFVTFFIVTSRSGQAAISWLYPLLRLMFIAMSQPTFCWPLGTLSTQPPTLQNLCFGCYSVAIADPAEASLKMALRTGRRAIALLLPGFGCHQQRPATSTCGMPFNLSL